MNKEIQENTHLYSVTEDLLDFPPSLLYYFIDNKLSVITVPDRHDLTWGNIMNWEDHCCGHIIKKGRESIKHAAHMRHELNTCVSTCVSVWESVWWAVQCMVQPDEVTELAALSWQWEKPLAIVSCSASFSQICPERDQCDFRLSFNCFRDWCWVGSADNQCLPSRQVFPSLRGQMLDKSKKSYSMKAFF